MNDCAETGLVLHDDVWNTHLAAKGGKVDDKFDGVNVVGDDNEAGLLGLDKTDGVVQTVSDVDGPLGVLVLGLTVSSGLCSGIVKALLLLLLGLWSVLVEETEKLRGGVLVQSVVELVDGRWNLEALVEDDLLAL